MRLARMLTLLLLTLPAIAFADRNVGFTGDFESGKVQPKTSDKDGFFVHTVPVSQSGKQNVSSGDGGFGPDSKLDTRVVRSDKVDGQTVKPRAGEYFVRSSIDKKKNYSGLNSGRDKPRSKLYVKGGRVAFDEEGYLGFSIYLPKNLEPETSYTGSKGSTKLLQVQSDGSRHILFVLGVYVPKGKSEAHWLVKHELSDGKKRKGQEYDLGPVNGDLGQWTDFVLRYRFNPFSTKTNAKKVGGKDKVYEGNKGILQLWKATGRADAAGNRDMRLTSVNIENKPVGRVPHAKKNIDWHFRIYKGNWKKKPTSIRGPIFVGFDEIRDGRVKKHGTTYSDVHPGGLGCTDRCPRGTTVSASADDGPADALPQPPRQVTASD